MSVAAQLMRIKSRALLPETPYDKPDDEDEDEEQEEELTEIQSARDLVEKLIEYRRFKELSVALGERESEQARLHFREKFPPLPQVEEKQEELRLELGLLLKAFSRVLKVVEAQRVHEIVRETWTIEEKMADVRLRLKPGATLNVTKLFENCVHKVELITTFLAVLEMCKRGAVTIRQADQFGEITIQSREEEERDDNPADSE